MLSSGGFDLWADGYDKSVDLCDKEDKYPFAGYKDVLNKIYRNVHKREYARVLDIGFGTGTLTKKLYDDGYQIYGIDFSQKMIDISKKKMPYAVLMRYDFAYGLPEEVSNIQFDFIISSYAFHHLTDIAKVELIKQSLNCLTGDGMVLIGDVSFETRVKLDTCRKESGNQWDNDEIYMVFDEMKDYFPEGKIMYKEISYCAGITMFVK